jgi:hypothetical protein
VGFRDVAERATAALLPLNVSLAAVERAHGGENVGRGVVSKGRSTAKSTRGAGTVRETRSEWWVTQ